MYVMSHRLQFKWVLLCSAFLLSANYLPAAERFEVRDGDRIVLLGDTLIEREQASSWLETVLYSRFADRHFIVRNLGWSADTPAGESRASFDFAEADKGFQALTNKVAEEKADDYISRLRHGQFIWRRSGIAKVQEGLESLD